MADDETYQHPQQRTCICSGTSGIGISAHHWVTAGVCRQAFPHALSWQVKHHPRKPDPPGHGTLASQHRHAPTPTRLFLPPCPVHPPGSPAAAEHPCSSPSHLKCFGGTMMCTMTMGQQQCEGGRGAHLPSRLLSFDVAWTKTGQASNSPILSQPSFAEEHAEIHRNEDWERWSLWDTPPSPRSTSGNTCLL